jgi:acetylornithine deacetylase/succinyl-diaminopimelate desuccinylase-like protein
MRIPPTVDGEKATSALRRALTEHAPYNAKVSFEADWGASGWNAPDTAPWLKQALDDASRRVYGKDAAWVGEGGTIPFMNMLGQRFPQAQFMITGVLGPHSNAHGPNEFLHIPYAKQLTAAVAEVVAAVR